MKRQKIKTHLFAVLIFLSMGSVSYCAAESDNIRPPAVAGSFYPSSASELREMITRFLDSVPDEKWRTKLVHIQADRLTPKY